MEATRTTNIADLKLEQPPQVTKFLQDLISLDTYNKFCIDCNRLESTHANITYGTFVCQECANQHFMLGMDKSYIKALFGDPWDNYQLRIVQIGGNKRLWDFLKQYNGLEQKPIAAKYKSAAASFYRKKISAEALGHQYDGKEPPKNAEEFLDRGVEGAKVAAKTAGEGLVKVGSAISEKFKESGISEKFKGMFAKK